MLHGTQHKVLVVRGLFCLYSVRWNASFVFAGSGCFGMLKLFIAIRSGHGYAQMIMTGVVRNSTHASGQDQEAKGSTTWYTKSGSLSQLLTLRHTQMSLLKF